MFSLTMAEAQLGPSIMFLLVEICMQEEQSRSRFDFSGVPRLRIEKDKPQLVWQKASLE